MTTRTDSTSVDLLSRIEALEAHLEAQADGIERLKRAAHESAVNGQIHPTLAATALI